MNISGNLAAQRKVVNLQDTTKKLQVVKQEDEKQVQQATQQSTQAANYGNATTEQYLANMGINIISTNKTPQVVDIKPELTGEIAAAAVQALNELNVVERSNTLIDDVKKFKIGDENDQTVQTKGFMDWLRKGWNGFRKFWNNPGTQKVVDTIVKFTSWIPVYGDWIKRVVNGINQATQYTF
ncbi:MAG: hypothetical protein E7Z87_02750 [Cyanobacteria bacterium SIG26]|nr:hypothetical protein [Cyanobacteria bacterium SIG26]